MTEGATTHRLGKPGADIALLEFGSFHCPHCHAAHEVIANLRDRFGERLCYEYRHRPITGDELARRAAVLAEYAHETTGDYWQAHDALMQLGTALRAEDLEAIAARLGLPPRDEVHEAAWSRAEARVQGDVEAAQRAGARYAPTFIINGRRYEGPWDERLLAEAMLGSLGHRLQSAALDFARWAPSTGLLLLAMTLAGLVLANSPLGGAFEDFWLTPVSLAAGHAAFALPLREWINDGLLTIFFLVVGLEVKREFTVGRLATRSAAALPLAAALGGMALPALIFLALAPPGYGHGWAIPTTTDTAFAIAVIAVLGARVPVELRIFLTAAVICDDLAAIVILALFYSSGIDLAFLAAAFAAAAAMLVLNRGGVYRALPYAVLGIALWVCLHGAGVHATLAGVVVAVLTPTLPPANLRALLAQAESAVQAELQVSAERILRHGPSEPVLQALDVIHERIESPAAKLLRSIEPWSSYVVLPAFALANAGLAWSAAVFDAHLLLIAAVTAGLVIGKPLGMLAAAALAVRLGIATKPAAYTWRQLAGAAALAGIGFTMSLYIAGTAFPDPGDYSAAKTAVFLASMLAAALGAALLWPARR